MGVHERSELRDRVRVFRDRAHAGEVLAEMLAGALPQEARVLAIPAGGVPVASRIAARLGLPLDVAVVSKITPPWSSEVGYGAVAFDGRVRLNEVLVEAFALADAEIRRGIDATREKVERRVARLRGEREPLDVRGTLLLVDDGLASGFTMRAAVEALRAGGATRVWVVVPTGSERTVLALAPQVDALYCANIRAGGDFAVAEAYERWADVSEEEAAEVLQSLDTPPG